MNNFKYIEQLLYDYNKKEEIYRQFDLEIEEIKLTSYDSSVGAIDYSKDKIQSSVTQGSMVEDLVIKAQQDVLDLERRKKLKQIHFSKLELAMKSFNEIEQNIVKYYYHKKYTWNVVSRMIGLNRTSLIDYRNKMINRIIEEANIKIDRSLKIDID